MAQLPDSGQAGAIQLIEEIVSRWDQGQQPEGHLSYRDLARWIVASIENRNERLKERV